MRSAAVLLLSFVATAACGPGGDDEPGECADSLLPGDLVITEVFADADAASGGSGADEGREWFEVFNNGDRALDLSGLTITHSRPDGSRANTHVVAAVTIPPGEYLVLGNVLPDLTPDWVDYGYADGLGDLFNTDGGQIALRCGAMDIDVAQYDNVEAGVSRQFDGGGIPDYTANDDLASWCAATPENASEFEPSNFGTPGSPNEDCAVIIAGQCNDNGIQRDAVPAMPGDLVLTEVLPSPRAVSSGGPGPDGEWFEALVTRDIDLNGLGLDRAGDASNPDLIENELCLRVTAGSYVVFGKTTDGGLNGGLPRVDGTFDFSLVGAGDVQLVYGTTVLDNFTWSGARTGASLQVDPDFATLDGNDLEANWCDGSTPYGVGELGTPGMANLECAPVVGPDECLDEISGDPRPIVKPAPGQLAITEWMADPALVGDTAGEWIEILTSAAFDLNQLQIGDDNTALRTAVTTITCVPVAAGTYVVFAQGTDPLLNGNVMNVTAAFPTGIDLGNSMLRSVSVGIDDLALDTKMWMTTSSGNSIQIDGDGTQCNAPATTPTYNDGSDIGTPGAVHTVECP